MSDTTFFTMSDAYPYLIRQVLERGEEVTPNGIVTRELLGVHFTIEDIVHGGVPIGVGRRVGVKPMAIDGLVNLSGYSWPRVQLATGPFLRRFADRLLEHDSEIVMARSGAEVGELFFQGSYGPRILAGLGYCEDELRRDRYSRRAVINLWDQDTDFEPVYKDRPCTTQIQFLIRDGLEIFVTMRSNDVWTGTCYDVYQFGQVQQALAHVLGEYAGPYHHHAISFHAYKHDWDNLYDIGGDHPNPREDAGADWSLLDEGTYNSIRDVQSAFISMAQQLNDGFQPTPTNGVEEWYANILVPANGA